MRSSSPPALARTACRAVPVVMMQVEGSISEGWSLFPVYSNGIDMDSPLTHFYVANNCADYPGWSCDPAITKMLEDFANATDSSARRKIADEIQVEAYRLTLSVMWGQFARPAGYRKPLKNMIVSAFPMFWQVET